MTQLPQLHRIYPDDCQNLSTLTTMKVWQSPRQMKGRFVGATHRRDSKAIKSRRCVAPTMTFRVTPAQTLLSLIGCHQQQTIEIAQKLVKQRTIQGIDILNFVETVLVYKLPHLTREEIKTMLGLDTELKQTRFYQEIAEEERLEGRMEGRLEGRKVESITLLTRQLRRKFGLLPELEAALQQLPEMELEQLEDLADALLDFKVVGDLQAWLHKVGDKY